MLFSKTFTEQHGLELLEAHTHASWVDFSDPAHLYNCTDSQAGPARQLLRTRDPATLNDAQLGAVTSLLIDATPRTCRKCSRELRVGDFEHAILNSGYCIDCSRRFNLFL